jgi:hypothetical protein
VQSILKKVGENDPEHDPTATSSNEPPQKTKWTDAERAIAWGDETAPDEVGIPMDATSDPESGEEVAPIKFSLCDKCCKGALFHNIDKYSQVCMQCYTDMSITVRESEPDCDMDQGSDDEENLREKVVDMMREAGVEMDSGTLNVLAMKILTTMPRGTSSMDFAAPKKKQKDEGGGARGKQSKEETMTEMADRMNDLVESLARVNDDCIPPIIQGVALVNEMQPENLWARLQMIELESIANTAVINGNLGNKSEKIARIVYAQFFAALVKRAKQHKAAEELMMQSIIALFTKKFGNESGMIQWQSSDPAQINTVAHNLLTAIKQKTLQNAAAGR